MLILFHITIAFTSMAFTAYTYMSPSQTKLYTAYALAAATLGSGTYLLTQHPSHLVPACIMGLIYFGIVGAAIAAAQRKLASAKVPYKAG